MAMEYLTSEEIAKIRSTIWNEEAETAKVADQAYRDPAIHERRELASHGLTFCSEGHELVAFCKGLSFDGCPLCKEIRSSQVAESAKI